MCFALLNRKIYSPCCTRRILRLCTLFTNACLVIYTLNTVITLFCLCLQNKSSRIVYHSLEETVLFRKPPDCGAVPRLKHWSQQDAEWRTLNSFLLHLACLLCINRKQNHDLYGHLLKSSQVDCDSLVIQAYQLSIFVHLIHFCNIVYI